MAITVQPFSGRRSDQTCAFPVHDSKNESDLRTLVLMFKHILYFMNFTILVQNYSALLLKIHQNSK